MKMVQPIVLRGLAVSTAALLFACSGTRTDDSPEMPSSSDPVAEASAERSTPLAAAPESNPEDLTPLEAVLQDPEPQDPAPQDPAPQDPEQQDPQPQNPGQQDPELRRIAEQRRQFLINEGLKQARRALELNLYRDALRDSANVIELDPENDEARSIMVAAMEFLGDETAKVARSIDSKVLQARISLERDRFRASQLTQQGDAQSELARYVEAVESYETALKILDLNPFATPGSAQQRGIEQRLERTRQLQAEAMQQLAEEERNQTRAQLEEAERRRRMERDQRVVRLMVQANRDFQQGQYRQSIAALDQAIALDPTNRDALALHDLASRAYHENKVEVARQRWKQQWTATMDDLNQSMLPQTETIVFDVARWAEIETRTPFEFSRMEEMDAPEDRAITEILDRVTVEHNFSSATIDNWAQFYATVTGVNFVVAPSARELDETTTTLTDLRLGTRTVSSALDVISAQTGVKWHVRDGVVELVSSETRTGRTYLRPYGVRDLVFGIKSQPGPKLKLTVPGDEFSDFGFDDEEPLPSVVNDGVLVELITENIANGTWEGEPGTINYQSGVLLVRHTGEIHQQVEKLLSDLRGAVGIQVDIEARFLKVEDSFLEDVGVDFRGLGDQSSEGIPGRGLENNNRSNLRFDDFGRPEEINTASPGSIGTGTEPGVFFDDGGDGDLLARTENLYDRQLGGGPGGLDNSGGLALQYAYLDDTELQVVLQAVAKNERSEEIVAPRLLVYNNTRAHMQALRHTSYIRDFDVEIAQAAAVANPIVDVVRDGVVLDVRPVVSADRRFITMELRPTVMQLQLPIPTFTTTLGAGQPVSIQLPDVNLQSVRTTITMPDGGSILLGGMKLAERQNRVSGVPVLKDLPVLSFLFSRKGNYTLNRKIIILISASIIMTEEFEPTLIPDEYEALLTSGGR